MVNSFDPSRTETAIPKVPPPGSIPQPKDDGLPHEMVPDWNNIGLFTAGIAVGAVLGAAVALLFAPASGEETRHSLRRRVRRDRDDYDDVWGELAEELERAAAETEAEVGATTEA
jgi:YtxH-like protein